LQVIGGFSGEEIGAMLDLNNNTVMTRLFRARNKLRASLEGSQNTDPKPAGDTDP
jgi:RNA polymerase sigma-70 factor, ECF subfamily